MFTYLYLDTLPPVPDQFITQALQQRDQLLEEAKTWNFSDSYRGDVGVEYCYEGNIGTTRRVKRGESLGPEWDKWVQKNIGNFVNWSRVQVSVPKPGTASYMHDAHTDNPEAWALLYVIDLGGDDVWTKFWREMGKPLMRPGCAPNNYIGCGNFDNMQLIDSAKLQSRRWTLVNSVMLHSIHGVTGPRSHIYCHITPESVGLTW